MHSVHIYIYIYIRAALLEENVIVCWVIVSIVAKIKQIYLY